MVVGSAAPTTTVDQLGNAIAEDLEAVDHMEVVVVVVEAGTGEIEDHLEIDKVAAEEAAEEAVRVAEGVATLTHTYQAMEEKMKVEEETTGLL